MFLHFTRPAPGAVTRYVFVGNVYGLRFAQLEQLFAPYGSPTIYLPSDTAPNVAAAVAAAAAGTAADSPCSASDDGCARSCRANADGQLACSSGHCYLAFEFEEDAAAALAAAPPPGTPWPAAEGRNLVVKYADIKTDRAPVPRTVFTDASTLGVPGLTLLQDFVSPDEEAGLMAAIDGAAWVAMAKRRVQHYGYAFDYASRNIDCSRRLGPLPGWASAVAQRIAALPQVDQPLDQLTVNEYTPGVGLAPHIDTHSAFSGPIVSVSLVGHTVMEMRLGDQARPLLLPPRSLLVMAGESRYAWQHYIPHRKADFVEGQLLPRPARRVSLTFRQVRGFACACSYPQHCDSQQSDVPPTRISQLEQQLGQEQGAHQGQQQQEAGEGQQAAQGLNAVERPHDGGKSRSADGSSCNGSSGESQQAAGGDVSTGGACSNSTVPCAAGVTTGSGVNGGGCNGGAASARGGGGGADGPVVDAALAAMESEYVHKVYDAIAPHFSATRFAIWPKVRAFIDCIPPGGVVADVGCGNGKYFGVRKDIAVLGSDRSAGLAEVAARRLRPAGLPEAALRGADVFVGDGMMLPYRAASCDAVLCIAVLHHISSRARRVRMLRQLLRVLRPGGRALVTVWASEQEDPAKTLAKWQRIPRPEDSAAGSSSSAGDGAAAATASASGHPPLSPPGKAEAASADATGCNKADDAGGCGIGNSGAAAAIGRQQRATTAAPPSAIADGAAGTGSPADAEQQPSPSGRQQQQQSPQDGGDYFVPWHLPFYRAEAAAAARSAGGPGPGADAAGGGAVEASGAPRIDASKGAVIFQRYYHLFDRGELEALVEDACASTGEEGDGGDESSGNGAERLSGRLVDSFYDKSNWCAVFERSGPAAALPART